MCSENKKVEEPVRNPAVSGSFYPSSQAELSRDIGQYLLNAPGFKRQDANAIIVPHAGYVFSAPIAATSYKTLHKNYKNIFIIGSSHHINFNGISIYNQGDYQTPLGRVTVNQEIVKELITNNPLITYKKEAHAKEHTIEVQLPFLQSIYGDKLNIVPIIIASSDLATIKSLSESLKPYFSNKNLFIISTDLSHYPSYNEANIVDINILHSLTKNSSLEFLNAISKNEDSQTKNLQTSACGWSSLLTLLYLTENSSYTYELLEYKNSGDSKYGEKDRVVGYGAVRVYKELKEFSLNSSEKKELRKIAQLALETAVLENKRVEIDESKMSPKLKEHLGAFVTLYFNSNLKGCIGRFEPEQELFEVVIDMAIAASRHDSRFSPVNTKELQNIQLEISVLTPRKKVTSIDEIEVGKHGIYVKYGVKSGTYLPHVATDMNWSKKDYFQSCCEDKAGIAPKDCKDSEIYVYEAIIF